MSNFVYIGKLCIFVIVVVAAITTNVLAEMPLKNPDLAATEEGYFNFMEVYKEIPNFNGYDVSNLGNVRSFKRNKERILKPGISKKGYKMCCLFKNNKGYSKPIHVLVAITFLGHKQTGTMDVCVDHINNIKTDNRLENLQLLSNRENVTKSIKGKTSKCVGVDFRPTKNTWRSRIYVNGKTITLGHYKTELEASNAYQQYLNKLKS